MNFNIDEKEGNVSISLNPQIHTLETINAAAYAFLDQAYIVLDGNPEKEIIVRLYPKKEQELKRLGLEFHEQLINYSNYLTNLKANSEITKKLMERALFSANPNLLDEAEEQEINDLLTELEEDDDPEIKDIVNEIKNDKDKAE